MSTSISSLGVSVSSSSSLSYRAKTADSAATPQSVEQEKVSLGNSSDSPLTYAKPNRIMPADLQTMLDDSQRKVDDMMNLIRPLLEQQGLNIAKVASGEQKLTVDQPTIDAAKQAISEDGEWGVKKVSERILSFAKFAMGNDPAQLDKIRDAVKLGFDQAKEVLGGTLPEISQKTYDTIMGEFARWEKEGIPSGDTVSLASNKAATTDKVSA
ncbi:hypothetical protein HQ393_09825 [Chitinibacter bivalviorum]|uniref:DUF5610 domain-containing protein n=1 Tax=Chitinibacter bivalviorum TaxID=2739434 RepID=A0A7H9BJH1_9NEIS|nr:hypothetical protein [Chitinibacter bivalviorum]QLG88522.1 hypothetical protein HQ393_09825 [Chitinibacter bivalviorum]